jgi:hypothetical protein
VKSDFSNSCVTRVSNNKRFKLVWYNRVPVVFKWRWSCDFHLDEEANHIAFYGATIKGRAAGDMHTA